MIPPSIELVVKGDGAMFLKFDGPLITLFELTSSRLAKISYSKVNLYCSGCNVNRILEEK
jgi:hypothetical protein